MPDTTDNFDIPFLDGTELVRDYPTFSEDLAEAIDAGLTGGAGPVPFYRFVDSVYFESNGTFSKGDYPWLRAIRVKVQGAGAGGGGAQGCGTGEAASASGGSGGVFTESFYTDISALSSNVTVNVGLGGAGGAGGADGATGDNGNDGNDSSFGTQTASGGKGGRKGFDSTGFQISDGVNLTSGLGSGDLIVPGQPSTGGISFGTSVQSFTKAVSGNGGSSVLGGGAGGIAESRGSTGNGNDGQGFGGGGSGAATAEENNAELQGGDGGNGSDGIVIVELFA